MSKIHYEPHLVFRTGSVKADNVRAKYIYVSYYYS